AVRDALLSQLPALVQRSSLVAEIEHPRGKLNAEVAEISGSATLEHLDAFDDFERVANVPPSWLIHTGDQRDHALAAAHSGFNHQPCQTYCIGSLRHQRA